MLQSNLFTAMTPGLGLLSALAQPGRVSAAFALALLAISNTLRIILILLQPDGKIIASFSGPGSSVAHLLRLLENLPPESLIVNRNGSISLSDAVDAKVRIEFNPDLATTNWITLTDLTLQNSPYLLIDPRAPGSTNRFYRAITSL